MADCPKCGFTQPDDQYCANCGVDMWTFKPEPESLGQRVSKNLGVQVAVVLGILTALFSTIYVSQKEIIDTTLRDALKSDTEKQEDEATPVVRTQEVLKSPQTEKKAMALAAQSAESTVAAPTPTPNLIPLSSMEVAFAEVPEPLLQLWANEGQVLNDGGGTRSIMVIQDGGLSSLQRQEWEPFFLPGKQMAQLNTSQAYTSQFLEAVEDYESELGLEIAIQTKSVSGEKVAFEIQAATNLPGELDTSVNSSVISGSYEIPRGSVLIIVGILPQQSLREEAARVFDASPLSIMQSPEFLAGASEFVLILRPQ